jgi:hypothetical protein
VKLATFSSSRVRHAILQLVSASARGAVLRLAAAVTGAFCVASIAGAASAAHASGPPVAPGPRLIAPVELPGRLLAAAQAMETIRVSSERFSVQTAVASAGAHVPRRLERFLQLLFDTRLSGEATISPPAGAFRLTVLGHTVAVRVVRGRTYLYEPVIAGRDGGRPWVDLGRRGVGSLIGAANSPASPASGEARPFVRLAAALRAARALRELGAGTVDGQAITGYRAVVPSSALQQQARRVVAPRAILGGVFGGGRLPAAEPPDENLLLEAFVTPAGLPVRAHISLTSEGFSFSALTDVYAIDFPLSVSSPPRRSTISLAGLRRLERERTRVRQSGPDNDHRG